MATLASAVNTPFTPTGDEFAVQVSGGAIELMRKQTAGAEFVSVGQISDQGVNVKNPALTCVYEMRVSYGNPTVQADE